MDFGDIKFGLTDNVNLLASELRSCVEVEVDVLCCQSLIVLNMVSVDVNQHLNNNKQTNKQTSLAGTEARSVEENEVTIRGLC